MAGMEDGYEPVGRPRRTGLTPRQRLTSPFYWVAVVIVLVAVILVQRAYGSGWALLVIIGGPFLLWLAELLQVRRSAQ
jgi:hypothetical protein